MIRKRTVTQTVPAALSAPAVLAAIVVLVMAALLFAGCSSPYSSPNWPYGSGGGEGGGLNPLSMDMTPPGVVTHLAALSGSGTVTFTWLDPSDDDLDHIEIWVGTGTGNGTVVGSIGRGKQTFTGSGAAGAVLYYHFVAVDKSGNRSAAVNYMVTLSPVVADVTNLVGMITGADSVRLSWTDPVSPTFNQAEITHNYYGGPPVNVPKGTEQSAWKGLSTGTVYTFTVKASYTGGGGLSGGVSVSMTLDQDATPPGAVSGLKASGGGFGSVELKWTSPADADVQYVEITCEPVSGPAQTVNTTPEADGTYTWNGLAGGVTYTFTVKAVDHSGNRSEGRTITGTPGDYTPPGPVTGLQGIPGDGSVVLTWTDPGDADLSYIEFYHGTSSPQSTGKGNQTYTWNYLTNGASYTFTVQAVDLAGNRSAAVTVGPVPVILAGGGTISFAKVEGSSPVKWWEIHTFTASETLTFPSGYSSLTADYLIVAGGGGAGGEMINASDYAAGGGAGGLLYKTGALLPLTGNSVAVTVGAGGAQGAPEKHGANGADSAIGAVVVPGGGGGGGVGGADHSILNGSDGGSGGGNAAGNASINNSNAGDPGKRLASIDPEIQGNNGGKADNTNSKPDSGGGGGGAGGAGQNASTSAGGAGGAPWNAATAGAPWLAAAAGTTEFSRGGGGGGPTSPAGGKAGVNYGDGGSAGNNSKTSDGSGHGGVVVIRFQRD
jgi:hypothetical protein